MLGTELIGEPAARARLFQKAQRQRMRARDKRVIGILGLGNWKRKRRGRTAQALAPAQGDLLLDDALEVGLGAFARQTFVDAIDQSGRAAGRLACEREPDRLGRLDGAQLGRLDRTLLGRRLGLGHRPRRIGKHAELVIGGGEHHAPVARAKPLDENAIAPMPAQDRRTDAGARLAGRHLGHLHLARGGALAEHARETGAEHFELAGARVQVDELPAATGQIAARVAR
ncbi:MAG: hypothetical protein BWX86_00679 [Verrucomicrobia bacterium ADurb.Bin122]|nr:MAG: hypothetical protein BWX86_00679 [Verrucomicrobia bacterium ADurb.Bin122]